MNFDTYISGNIQFKKFNGTKYFTRILSIIKGLSLVDLCN